MEGDATTEKVHPIVRGTLERLEEEGVLRADESIVERELAANGGAPGVLFVTDQRVLFFRASALSEKTSLVSLPLGEVASVESFERRSPIRKRGVVRLGSAGDAEIVLEHLPGGQARAEEIARVIKRERERLRGADASR